MKCDRCDNKTTGGLCETCDIITSGKDLCNMCNLRPATCDDIDDEMCDECTRHNYPALLGLCALCGDHMSTHGFLCDEKKRTAMQNNKYEVIKGKFICMQNVIDSPSSLEETQKFLTHWHGQGYQLTDPIAVEDVILYSKKECLINWLIKIGKLKKVEIFQPFTIEIPINSLEEYFEVWHRMNAHSSNFDSYREKMVKNSVEKDELSFMDFGDNNSHKLWSYVHRYRRGPWKKLT